jgi:superfamily I DNA/RNA helicase
MLNYSDFTVLYRAGRQAQKLEYALTVANIPYRIVRRGYILLNELY